MNNKTTNKATFRKVGKIQNLYRHAKTGTYYSLIKRSGKQFRRSLKTNDLQLAKIRLNELQRDIPKLTGTYKKYEQVTGIKGITAYPIFSLPALEFVGGFKQS